LRYSGLLAGVVVFLVLALVAGTVALLQRGKARHSALVALARAWGQGGVIEPRLDRGLLLARDAMNLDASAETKSVLLAAVLRDPAAVGVFYGGDTGRRPSWIAISPDGSTLAVSTNVTDLELCDTRTFNPRVIVRDAVGGPPAFSPDGSLLAVSPSVPHPGVDLRDPTTGRLLHRLPAPSGFGTMKTELDQLVFSRDGRVTEGVPLWPPCLVLSPA
jgi:hypothetical protein